MVRGRAVLAGGAVVVIALSSGLGLALDREAAIREVDRFNRTWQGASCRLRFGVVIKKGADQDGWSQSPWMCEHGSGAKEESFCFRLRVSDRDALRPLMDDKTLRPGNRFVARGWSLSDGKKGLVLDLDLVGADCRAQWVFYRAGGMGAKGLVALERLRNIERYMRLDAYTVEPRSEELATVATTEPVARDSTVRGSGSVARPTALEVVAVAVQPVAVRPGEEVGLVVSYRVSGGAPGTGAEVVEARRLVRDGTQVAGFSQRVARVPGDYVSTLPVLVPADAPPGLYAFEAEIQAGGVTATGTAFFKVETR